MYMHPSRSLPLPRFKSNALRQAISGQGGKQNRLLQRVDINLYADGSITVVN